MSWFRDNCPRLAKAADQHNARYRLRRDQLFRAERLLAHRDLQLQRSFHSRSGKYIAERQRKLVEAQKLVDRLRAA